MSHPKSPPASRTPFLKTLILLVLLAGLAWGVWIFYRNHHQKEAGAAAGVPGGGRRGMSGPVTVATEMSREMDFEEWVTVSGTVTPLDSVVVRSRVDGQLMALHFQEGAFVKEGDLLAEIDPRTYQVQLDEAGGQRTRDEALLKNALADQERYEKLLKQDSIAKQQVDAQASLVNQYRAAVESDAAAVAAAQLQLDFTRISAPLSGRVGLRQIDPGNLIRASDANGLVSITRMDPMGLVFAVPQNLVATLMTDLRSGTAVRVEALAPDQTTVLAKGKLLTGDNEIDAASGTLRLKAEFPNADGKLFPNQFVNVRVRISVTPKSVVVPAVAVQESSRGRFVYTVADDSTVAFTLVEAGATYREVTRILSGLKPGEKVVTSGLDRLRDGSKITLAVEPPTRPPGADSDKPSGRPEAGAGKAAGEGRARQRKEP